MTTRQDLMKRPLSRVWTIENRAGPANVPEYEGMSRAGTVAQAFGDVTPVRIPDPDRYGSFLTVDTIRGEEGLPTSSIIAHYAFQLSRFLRLARIACPLDVQFHMGKCQNPQDFNLGWDKILILEGAAITNWSIGDLGALTSSENGVVDEEVPVTALDMYELSHVNLQEIGEAEIVQQVIDVKICDAATCGACGVPSDGCSVFFALTVSAGGSPGLPAELIYSQDGGTTLGETNVTSLAANEDPDEMACVGIYLVIVSNESCSLHYAPIADILNGTETWTEVTTGFVCAAGAPNAIFNLNASHVWIVGDGGYVYFADDITAGVEVQSAGTVTTENLNDVHALNEEYVLAVGANNAVIFSDNGGQTWQSITGPAVGIALNTCWMRGQDEWFVGTANGRLWYTRNGGISWTEKTFPGSGAGVVRHITFPTPTVGYMSHDTAAPLGRILRSIDGGHSWYVLPEGTGSIPNNDQINAVAACGENPNVLFAGGLAGDATDGILIKGAGA